MGTQTKLSILERLRENTWERLRHIDNLRHIDKSDEAGVLIGQIHTIERIEKVLLAELVK